MMASDYRQCNKDMNLAAVSLILDMSRCMPDLPPSFSAFALQHLWPRQTELDSGLLTISALRVPWLQQAADILTDAFVDAKQLEVYK